MMDPITEIITILIEMWQGFPCLFHMLTGAYCPGCGGTRALRCLLKGQLPQSFLYHPLILYLAVSVPGLILWYLRCRKKKKPFTQKSWQMVLFAAVFLVTANFFLKNYLLFQGIDVLAALDQGMFWHITLP